MSNDGSSIEIIDQSHGDYQIIKGWVSMVCAHTCVVQSHKWIQKAFWNVRAMALFHTFCTKMARNCYFLSKLIISQFLSFWARLKFRKKIIEEYKKIRSKIIICEIFYYILQLLIILILYTKIDTPQP